MLSSAWLGALKQQSCTFLSAHTARKAFCVPAGKGLRESGPPATPAGQGKVAFSHTGQPLRNST